MRVQLNPEAEYFLRLLQAVDLRYILPLFSSGLHILSPRCALHNSVERKYVLIITRERVRNGEVA